MLVKMRDDISDLDVQEVVKLIEDAGELRAEVHRGLRHTILTIIGDLNGGGLEGTLRGNPNVDRVERISVSYKLPARKDIDQRTVVDVGHGITIGNGTDVPVCAGPCSAESEYQVMTTAAGIRESGADILRGGAFKPRTVAGAFEGHGKQALKWLRKAADEFQMPLQTEVMDTSEVGLVSDYADILQLGTRNAGNQRLQDAVGKIDKPVVLKRGFNDRYTDWLNSAHRIMYSGNEKVILCERGLQTTDDKHLRNKPDIAAIQVIHDLSHLPVQFDAAHSVGLLRYIAENFHSGLVAGADSLLVEVHHNPKEALTDGQQSLNLPQFDQLMKEYRMYKDIRDQVLASRAETNTGL
jgi:3-deoxy-7-phosphoheptulonate synthase